ncbi:MAG: hypothetical protein HUU15_07860 [Candidatus Brocadiae bacterium]|nr:hypothetical protein [Candidatus Brocadiia bacterium]
MTRIATLSLALFAAALLTAPPARAEDKDKKKEGEREKKGAKEREEEEKKKKAAMEAAKRREEAEGWLDKDCPWPVAPDVERILAWAKRRAAEAAAGNTGAPEAAPGVAGFAVPPDRSEAEVSRHVPAVFGEGQADADLSWLDEKRGK